MSQLIWKKMTLIQGKSCPAQRKRGSKTPTGPSSHLSDRSNNKDLLGSNKPSPFEAPAFQVSTPKALEFHVARYTQKDLDQII